MTQKNDVTWCKSIYSFTSKKKMKTLIKVILFLCTSYCQFGTIYISFLIACQLWNLQAICIMRVISHPSIHSFIHSLKLHVIFLYLSISNAFYFSFRTNDRLPTSSYRQFLSSTDVLLPLDKLFHYVWPFLLFPHWRLTCTSYNICSLMVPPSSEICKIYFFAAGYGFVWNISVTSMQLLRMI